MTSLNGLTISDLEIRGFAAGENPATITVFRYMPLVRFLYLLEMDAMWFSLFYTKSTDWSYEKEFRKYQPLVVPVPMSNGNKFLPYKEPKDPGQIILFPYPKECIKCVIMGWKSSTETKNNVEEALKRNDIQVPIRKALPSPTRYEMVIRDLNEKGVGL